MKAHRMALVGASFVVAVYVGLWLTTSASAGTMELKDADGAFWDVSWGSGQVALALDASRGAGIGTLIKTVTFTDLKPITITFIQRAPAAADAFGLRFTMDEFVSNQSGMDWRGFNMRLDDIYFLNPPEVTADTHPDFAHFHRDGLNGEKFDLSTPFVGGAVGRGRSFITFLDGTPGIVKDSINGEIWKPTGIGIHDYTFKNTRRVFTLIETPIPVPEPTTTVLLLTGLLVAFTARRRNG